MQLIIQLLEYPIPRPCPEKNISDVKYKNVQYVSTSDSGVGWVIQKVREHHTCGIFLESPGQKNTKNDDPGCQAQKCPKFIVFKGFCPFPCFYSLSIFKGFCPVFTRYFGLIFQVPSGDDEKS